MKLSLLLIFFLFIYWSPDFSKSHVVFEEFGTMAGSVSYMHVTLHINISHVENLIHSYMARANNIKERIEKVYDRAIADAQTKAGKEMYEDYKKQALGTLITFIGAADEDLIEIDNLRSILPQDRQYDPQRSAYRATRSLKMSLSYLGQAGELLVQRTREQVVKRLKSKGFKPPDNYDGLAKFLYKGVKIFKGLSPFTGIIGGVFGTFMGLFNMGQMSRLKNELAGIAYRQNRIIEVIQDHEHQLIAMGAALTEIQMVIKIANTVRMPVIETQLNRGLSVIRASLDQLTHAVQQAHHHRLAIDFLDPVSLEDLYSNLESQAAAAQYSLLTNHPSDLFQLEVSYMFDGKDIVLFLHVPMVQRQALLTLYKLKPFPIPFSKEMALLPKASSSLLALTRSEPRGMMQIEQGNLVDCHQVNHVYICERQGVYKKDIKSHCLGALFEQDIPLAQNICDLELVPYQEAVLQLKNNWFLIYSPYMFTTYIECRNASMAAQHISEGVNQIFIDPSCRASLKNHTLISDFSLKLDSDITYFPWKAGGLEVFNLNEDDIKAALEVKTSKGEQRLMVSDILQTKHMSSRFISWHWIIVALAFTAGVALIILIFISIGSHRVISFRRRMRRIRNALDLMNQPPPVAPPRPEQRRLLPPRGYHYPALPDHHQEYELMEAVNRRARSLSKVDRLPSRMSSDFPPAASAPPSRSDSVANLYLNDPARLPQPSPRLQQRRRRSCPDCSERSRPATPDYLFLKATAKRTESHK